MSSIMAGPLERGNQKLKWIDRWIGIPLIFLWGNSVRFLRFTKWTLLRIRSPKLESLTTPRIGILMTAAIGDTILVSPLIQDLKMKWPESKIVVFLGTSNRAMEKLLLRQFANLELVAISATQPLRSLRQIWQAGIFDLWFDTGQWARLNVAFSLAARAIWRIGFKTRGQFRHWGYDHVVLHRADQHELENFRDLVRAAGVHPHALPKFDFKTKAYENSKYVVFHMFAGGQSPHQKEWPAASWIHLAERFPAAYKILLTGGPENASAAETFLNTLAATQPALASQVASYAGQLTLEQTGELLKGARIVISVNTGIAHLAAAAGVPTIGLHGPTNVNRWGPLGAHVAHVSSPRSCSPCLNLGYEFGCPLDACMREISVNEVWRAITHFEAGVTPHTRP